MPLSGKYSYRVKDGLKTAKGTPRKQVNLADKSMVDRVYEQSMPQTIAQLAGSVGAVVALEPQFMPQAYNESQAVTQQQQLAQMKYLNNMNMPNTADGTLYQIQGIPQRLQQESDGAYAGYVPMSIVEGLKRGFKKAEDIMTARQDYRHSVLNKDFYRDVKQKTEGAC